MLEYTNAVSPRAHGRSFIITKNGYMGLAPYRTRIGDVVTVLEGGAVPFVMRHQEGNMEGTVPERFEFVREAYIRRIDYKWGGGDKDG